jgi:peptidoglycan/LPS O-acetylase OafA/YrhL
MSQYGTNNSVGSRQGGARFEVLDSLRGICALLVACFHFPISGMISQSAFLRSSYLFVDFFFVLSGFVIAHSYAQRLERGEGLAKFLLTRFGRLAPLHLFMLLVLVVFELIRWQVPQLSNGQSVFSGRNTLDALFMNVTMLHGLGMMDQLTWNTPSWSISTELFAYVFFGLSMVLFGRKAMAVFALIVIAAPILLFAYSPQLLDVTYDFGLVRCLYGFSFGVLINFLFKNLHVSDQIKPSSKATWTLVEVMILFAIVRFVILGNADIIGLIAPLMFGLAVLVFVNEGGLISYALRAKPFLLLGKISYSIYLTHMFVQGCIHALARYGANHLNWLPLVKDELPGFQPYAHTLGQDIFLLSLMLTTTVLLSALTYRFVELPSNAWFRKRAATLGRNSNKPDGLIGKQVELTV